MLVLYVLQSFVEFHQLTLDCVIEHHCHLRTLTGNPQNHRLAAGAVDSFLLFDKTWVYLMQLPTFYFSI